MGPSVLAITKVAVDFGKLLAAYRFGVARLVSVKHISVGIVHIVITRYNKCLYACLLESL